MVTVKEIIDPPHLHPRSDWMVSLWTCESVHQPFCRALRLVSFSLLFFWVLVFHIPHSVGNNIKLDYFICFYLIHLKWNSTTDSLDPVIIFGVFLIIFMWKQNQRGKKTQIKTKLTFSGVPSKKKNKLLLIIFFNIFIFHNKC